MKNILVGTVLLLASTSQADVIRCVFTEPFYNTVYSMTQSTLTYSSFDGGTKVIKNVSFQIKAAGVFELVAKDGTVMQTLKLTGQGSDGMSDNEFPYEVEDHVEIGGANNGVGGCSSNFQKTKQL